MKRTLMLATMGVLVLMLGISAGYADPTGPGMMGPGYGYGENWEYCPYCGNYTGPGYGMGPGMMGPGYGYGMGPWMMGRGYGGHGMGPWMMGRGYGMMGPGYGMGPWMMGHGMMGYGYGMGPGMMGRGYGGYGMMGPGYGYGPQYGYGRGYEQPPKPLDEDQAKQEVEDYLRSTRNPNLKVGKIEEKGKDYEVDIETKEGSLVNRILVNKDTGWMRSAY